MKIGGCPKIGLFLAIVLATSSADARAESCVPKTLPVCDNQARRPPPPGSDENLSPLRRDIIARAASQIGLVSELQGNDCNKRGWKNLAQYFETATGEPISPARLQILKRPRKSKDDVVKIAQWCGIFALWAVKTAAREGAPPGPAASRGEAVCSLLARDETIPKTRRKFLDLTYWSLKPRQLGLKGLKLEFGNKGIQPGDIVVFKDSKHHYAIVERIIGDRIYTIDGNSDCQMVLRKQRKLEEVVNHFRVE